ncbi:MAG: OmpA family protein [Bdellovibrionales bacterium]
MSLRSPLYASRLLAVSVFVFGMGASAANAEATTPSVQTFVNEALPMEMSPTQNYLSAPIAAGSMTLDDVLKAHPRAVPKAPAIPSTSGLMMSEGLKTVLQKAGITSATPPTIVQAPQIPAPAAQAQMSPVAPTPSSSAPSPSVAGSHSSGVAYEPGQAPKTLGTSADAPLKTASGAPCTSSVQKWEKSCGEAGYPATFFGKISGETRGNCADGTLQDVWVTNTCAPPGASKVQAADPAHVLKQPAEAKAEAAPAPELKIEKEAPAVTSSEGPRVSSCSDEDENPSAACTALAAQIQPDEAEQSKKEAVREKGERESSNFFSRTWDSVFGSSASDDEEQPAPQAEALPPTPQEAAPRDANDFCGVAAETMAYEAPEKGLCRIGSASAVNGDGPWTWSCTNNAGALSSCKTLSLAEPDTESPQKASSKTGQFLQLPKSLAKASASAKVPVPALACGTASGQPAKAKPTSDLCQGGKAGKVLGKNPWKWTCSKGKKKVSCATIKSVDGVCGSSNGISATAAPSKNLCKKGAAGSVSGDGPWVWACAGVGDGSSASCSAPRIVPQGSIPPKPDVLKEKPSIPTPSKSFLQTPALSPVPEAAKVEGDVAPESAPGMPETSKPVDPPAIQEPMPAKPVLLKPTQNGAPSTPLVLATGTSPLLFSPGSGNVEEKAFDALDKLVSALKRNETARISLFAYADGVGTTPRAAKRLSLTRALSVRDYLVSKGIPENRVDVHAEGIDTTGGNADRVDVKANN